MNVRGWRLVCDVHVTLDDLTDPSEPRADGAFLGIVIDEHSSILDLAQPADAVARLPAVANVRIEHFDEVRPPAAFEPSPIAALVRTAANLR